MTEYGLINNTNNIGKNIPFLISIFIMVFGLGFLSHSNNLFKPDNSKVVFILNTSKMLFIFFLIYGVTNIFKYSKNKNLLNILLSFVLSIFLGYFSFGKNIFHDDIKFKPIIDIFLDFSFIYSLIWIFLHLLKNQFASANHTGQIPKTWNKIGVVALMFSLYIVLITIAIGNVYHEEATTIKKTMVTVGATSLLGSSFVILNYLMKK